MRVGLLVTCLVDVMRPEIGFSTIKLLEAAGCEVVAPESQTCCGQPAYSAGNRDAARALAEKFLDEFEIIEKIVVHDFTHREMLEDLRKKLLYLSDLKEKALTKQNSLTPIPVFPYGEQLTKLPTTLSELFAIEQQKIESKEV